MSDKPTSTQRIAAGLNSSAEEYEGKWEKSAAWTKAQTTLGQGYEKEMSRSGYFRDGAQAAQHLRGRNGSTGK